MPWATVEQARVHWPVGSAISDAAMGDLLATAEEQCREFVHQEGVPVPDPLPFRFTYATILQARELYNAGQRDNADVVGVGDFGLRAGDLTRHVKRLLRPAVVTWGIG